MPATRDGKLWRSQFYYKDWQGVRRKKNKRGFKTKGEADEWERNFLQQQQKNLDINFENFVEIYFADMENRLRESTIINKRYVFDLKVTPYFKNKKMCEIQTSDIRAWQNELIKKGYAPTYLKSINNQLAALFNYAVRYYDLRDNPCRKAGSIGKSKADEMDFWTKQEFKEFLPSMDSKPEARMAFLLLYWTGMRIGELLALTYEDIDLEKRCITINKSYQRLNGKDMITPPKTPKSNRQISIPPFLVEELKEYCSMLYGITANERMFRFTKSFMEHEMVRGIKATGVRRIRLHDLRRRGVAMSGVHKYPTISFRISPRERDEIEAKIKASGMQKKDYFVRSCIYNKVCVVGKKEVIYQLVEELQLMQYNIVEILKQVEEQEILLSDEGLEQMKNDCLDMLKAIIWMLDGAKYLWQGTEKSPDSGNC